MLKLFKTANKDKEITFDEGRILRVTDFNVSKLYEYSIKAWEDKVLSEEEKSKLTFLIKKVLDDAITVAEFDDIVTDQEQKMLDVIKDTIEDFYCP